MARSLVLTGGPKKAAKTAASAGKAARFYPADDVAVPKKSRQSKNATKTRASITAGSVVILLAGRFRGKRAVVLKVLESGLLLVSGPFKVNGVPLKRVNQTYVIATSTKVDVSKVSVPANVNDDYFKNTSKTNGKNEEEFFNTDRKAAVVSDQRKKDQKAVDTALLSAIKSTPMLKEYLSARFTLTKNDKPHEMIF
ncbi:hypothetical protein TrCOL_g2291 [Triparma columacea]|jgi:large subunit ribosomal protein L6e|uniref:60S ribosomal protein L6 n=1 Tax=Triparma columacea TaxID=722753 RepID=A0A9W7FYG1_9STRA|nr:hypothetical protein TrCOL_g2291 [Triparma columacea]